MLTRKLLSLLNKNTLLNTAKQWLPATRIKQNGFCTTHASKVPELSVNDFLNYSQEESEKIVNTINNSSTEELAKYLISKKGVNKIESWKKRYGPLRSPKDLLEVEGLNVKIIQKFCTSLLKDEFKANTTKVPIEQRKTNSFVIPTINSVQICKIRSCVAVHVAVTSVSWTRLDLPKEEEENEIIEPCLLTDWQYHSFAEKKPHLDSLVHKCLYYDQHIPAADCYLFENPKTAQASSNPGNAEQQNVNVEKAQMTAMLSFALSARRRDSSFDGKLQEQQKAMMQLESPPAIPSGKADVQIEPMPNVFYMRNFLHSRLFRHMIGTEKVSTEQTIFNLMQTNYNALHTASMEKTTIEQRNLIRSSVLFTAEQRELYSTAEGYKREFLGQALLLNLAFLRLVLLKDDESIRKVTRNPKKYEEELT